ncbi:P-loop containing nucleoside triphosphate hydrolase protein [Chytridium lagenaria]|nr:P-loop containing nucleoside triphosphate hydrolase protein [Chytridium lagenaria]
MNDTLMERFCSDDPDGWGPWSALRPFDLTACFENTILAQLPRLLLLLLAIPRLYVILQRPTCPVPKSGIYFFKIFLSLVLAALTAVDGVCFFLDALSKKDMTLSSRAVEGICHPLSRHDLLASSLGVVVYVFAALLHHIEHFRCSIGSTALLFFWLFDVIASSIRLRTIWLSIQTDPLGWPSPLLDISIRTLVMVLAFIVFVLENLPKPKPYYSWAPLRIWKWRIFGVGDPIIRAATTVICLLNFWNEELAKKHPRLLWACIRAFGPLFLSAAFLKAAQDLCSFIQPTFLKLMMEFVSTWKDGKEGQAVSRGAAIAFLMLGTALTQTLFLHQYFHICIVVGMRVKSAVTAMVYKKALKLSSSSRQSSTVGGNCHLMSVDAGRLGDLTTYLHILWSGPFQISLALYFLYDTLGVSIFAGVAVMIVMVPINAYLATKTKLMDEVLNGIKVIKLYAWEIPFMKKVTTIRDQELKTLKMIGILSAVQSFTWDARHSWCRFSVSLCIRSFPRNPLLFVCLALFNLLQFPLSIFPSVVTSVVESSVAFNRLRKFLMNEELDPEAVIRIEAARNATSTVGDNDVVERVMVKDATFRWIKDSGEPILENLSFSVSDRTLLAVIGSVGAGKSSLLSGILGEIYKTNGEVKVQGSIAYVSQSPWIMNATLRENVLFGKRYDPKFYEETIAACGLKPDIDMLPGGDLTEIGEKGINLSGGQKQRISLARAVYARADIYLLDDTLSAVGRSCRSSHFDNVIGPRGMLRCRARIFVTHGLNYLSRTDSILLIQDGKVVESGDYESLMRLGPGGKLYALVKEHGKRREASESADGGITEDTVPAVNGAESKLIKRAKSIDKLGKSESSQSLAANASSKLIAKEESAKGSVAMGVYAAYAQACSWPNVWMYLAAAIISQFLSISQNLYLADWANSNDKAETVTAGEDEGRGGALRSYGAIGLIYSGSVIFQTLFAWVYCGIRSARFMHSQMLENILHLPQSFFDTTPLGRILNRFSKDVYTLDETLPRTFQGYFRTFFVYMYFQRYYLFTSRELSSPIYAHFQETLAGVQTIRAYGQQNRFINANEERVDFNLKSYYPSVSSNRWLAVRLETLGSLIVFGSAVFPVITIGLRGNISASVTQTLNWMVRQACEIETNIVSVERIKEYVELPCEAPYEIAENKPQPTWPENGVIKFDNYSTRYRAGLDLVLNDITFNVRPRGKDWRKSSLTLALFRIIEPSSGTIRIDDIDIKILGLHDLRSKMTIIPQDAFLFTGTLRDNLDPFGETQDADLWAALESASLKTVVERLEGKLDAIVNQGGENFSVGQRQLVCLARAVLRRSKILILDEATAAIDYETDAAIQNTIRELAKDSTIITIAHRINTIIDYDRILVLDGGRVAELDTPKNLLSNKNSKFYSLARESGLIK